MSTSTALRSRNVKSPIAKSSPFQATKLWNQMIRNFREGIDLKKRRWKMKTYENTFCGHDAVDWFHLYLKSNQKFGDHVTRLQAKMLLQKFFENGIFEDARGKEKRGFEDDNHLYRFTKKADDICKSKAEITTQRSVTNLLRSVSVRRRPLSVAKSSFEGEGKACELKGAVTRSQSLKNACISPRSSMALSDSTNLAPAFQNGDSFSSKSDEKEFNENPVDIEPFSNSFHTSRFIDDREIERSHFDPSDEATYNSILQDAGIDNRAFLVADMSPFEMSFQRRWSLRDPRAMKYRHKFVVQCDEEDIIHEPSFVMNKSIRRSKLKRTKSSKLVTGISYVKGGQCQSPPKRSKVDNEVNEKSSITVLDSSVIKNVENTNDPAIPGSYLFDRRKSLRYSRKSDTSLCQVKQNKTNYSNLVHAGDEGSSFWKKRALQGLKNLLVADNLDDYINLSIISDYATENNIKMELKSAEIPEWTLSAMKYLVECHKIEDKDGEKFVNMNFNLMYENDGPQSRVKEKDDNLPSYDGFECDVFRAIQDHYESTLKEPLMTFNMFKLLDLSKEIIGKDHQTAIKFLQYICLLIPTWNRKQIYLIIRFMHRVSKNLLLKLSKELPNRELVIQTFYNTIIRNKELNDIEKDQMTSIRAVTFMIDNHEQIMVVPEELQKLEISPKEQRLEKENISTAIQKPPFHNEVIRRPVSMCMQYKREEFEKQKVDCTRQALGNLLNMIANDDTLHPKIKKRRLKEGGAYEVDTFIAQSPSYADLRGRCHALVTQQMKSSPSRSGCLHDFLMKTSEQISRFQFKKNYPEIYQEKFPEDNISTCSTTSQKTLRIRQAIRPFFFVKRNTEI